MTNEEKLKLANDKQAKQIVKLKAGKAPFKRLDKYLGTALALSVPIINMSFDFGLSNEAVLIYMVPILMLVYLGKNKNV